MKFTRHRPRGYPRRLDPEKPLDPYPDDDTDDPQGRPPPVFRRPEEFYDALGGLVNQDELRTKLASAFSQYTMFLEEPEVGRPLVLVAGPSGSGKTYAIEKLVEFAGLPFTIASSASISPPGYRGKTMLDVFIDHWQTWHTSKGVIFLDEIDKWCQMAIGKDHESVSMGVRSQAEILKYVERDRVTFIDDAKDIESLEDVVFETRQTMFILAGAFTGIQKLIRHRLHNHYLPDDEVLRESIPADFKAYGMIYELADRIGTWSHTNPLKAIDIFQILSEQERPRWVRRFERVGCELELLDGALGACSQHAVEQKEAARVAKSMLNRALDDIFVVASQHRLERLRVGPDEVQSGRIEVPI